MINIDDMTIILAKTVKPYVSSGKRDTIGADIKTWLDYTSDDINARTLGNYSEVQTALYRFCRLYISDDSKRQAFDAMMDVIKDHYGEDHGHQV